MQVVRSGWILAALAACCGCREVGVHEAAGPARLTAPAVAATDAPVLAASGREPRRITRTTVEQRGSFAAGMRIAGGRLPTPDQARDETDRPAELFAQRVTPTGGVTGEDFDILPSADVVADPSSDSSNRVATSAISLPTDIPGDPQPASHENITFPLTLDGAIATALNRNPDLVTLRAGEPVAQAVYGVAETYPWNPYVQIEVLPYAREVGGSVRAVTNYVLLMQTLEFAHQGRYRKAGASAAWNQVRWNIVQAELTNTAQTERLFFTALYQRDLRDLAERAATLNANLLGVVERRFNAGFATSAELTTAQVSTRQARKQAALAAANFQTALLALKRQLNMSTSEELTLIGQLRDFDWLTVSGVESGVADVGGPIQVSDQVTWRLASDRPDVLAAQSGTQVARAAADLAKANQVPNVQFGPFYERDETGTLFAGFRTQWNPPIWDSGRPLAQQRNAEARRQFITAQQLCARAQVEVQTALERYERARRLVERERAESADTNPDELETMRDLFEANQASILAVFATQTSLLQEERTYLDLLNEVAQAAADVTLAAGLPPARLVQGQRPPMPVPPATTPEQ
jgi:outer membrane protein, heavy metal efflux system